MVPSKVLAKKEDGLEYPADCYLPEPDDNGIYQPDIPKFLEKMDKEASRALKNEGEYYDSNLISYTDEDASAMMQVKIAFDFGETQTNIHFSNGTILPITAEEFPDLAQWFVSKRNAYFL
jgi:hypothetical protein